MKQPLPPAYYTPPVRMFLVTYIYRQASSGAAQSNSKPFDTLDQATAYICGEWYDDFCEINDYPQYWDEENLGGPMPSRDDFKEMIKKRKSKILFCPYDNHHALVQNELHLEEVKR